MRSLLIAATVLAVAVAATSQPDNMLSSFQDFKVKYNKKYSSKVEESKRFRVFVENMQTAAAIQAREPLATFGAGPYADMSQAEFKTRHNAEKTYAKLSAEAKDSKNFDTVTPEMIAAAADAKQINWNDKGAVTHVKNQGQCGSCWSFSTTGGVEGQWKLAGNPLTSLSEQLFVSCDTTDDACKGGLMDNAFQWAISDNGGNLVTAASYPYVSGGGNVPACDKAGKTFGAHITGFKNIPHNETEMAAWVFKNGPLSIAVDASTWQSYTGGILTGCADVQLDHGVLIVGFDDAHSPPYWVIKNSWGPGWGEAGFLRVKKGTDECLITKYPCSSIVGATEPPTPMPPTPPVTPMPPSPPISHQWVDLFSAPYTGVPKITLAISCPDGTHCYVPGGSQNDGFDMFVFDGKANGVFTPLVMPDKPVLMMAVAIGGTAEEPKGGAGGFGIGNGLQYAANKTTFENSAVPTLLVKTQDIRCSSSGNNVIAVDSAHLLISNDAAKTFSEKSIVVDHDGKCALGRYAAMTSDKEFFVTMGSWPESNNKQKGEKQVSERVYMDKNGVRKTRKIADIKKGKGKNGNNCGYTAVIAKTTDGGATFTNVFADLSNSSTFYFNAIDCSSPTNCVAVAEGFNADAAARIFHSGDGKTFTEVKKLVSGSGAAYSLMSARFKSGNEVWVAGSKESGIGSKAVFLVSKDGGMTWSDESGSLSNIGDISDISFTKDGKHGFATAITSYDDSTVLRYGAKLPPAPPAPPTSGPTGTFIQENCQGANCTSGCSNHTFQAGVCLPLNGGGSAMATCTPTTLEQMVYEDNNNCQGTPKTDSMPLNQCLKSTQGTYFENFCPNNGPVPSTTAGPGPAPITTSAPSTGSLTQKKCPSAGCASGCQNHTFPTGQCIPAQGGGSAKVTCDSTTITETIFQEANCAGQGQSQSSPANTCEQAEGGGYLENVCVTGQALAQSVDAVFMQKIHTLTRRI